MRLGQGDTQGIQQYRILLQGRQGFCQRLGEESNAAIAPLLLRQRSRILLYRVRQRIPLGNAVEARR